MNTGKLPFKLPAHQQGYIALLLWGVIAALLLRHDVYGIDEQSARSLLLAWSTSGDLAHPAVFLGMPDLRVLLFLPVGFLWTGSVFAPKILTLLLLAVSAWLLFGWKSRTSGSESALLASGLLIISPIAVAQIDSIAPGVYVLACFALGYWLDTQYRNNPRPFNGWFFFQIILCAFSVSLHPAGLAYPLALLWSWRGAAAGQKRQWALLGGIIFVVSFFLTLKYLFSVRILWNDLMWGQSALKSLSTIFSGSSLDQADPVMQWAPGALVLALAILVFLFDFRRIWQDLAGRTLLIGSLLGAMVGDPAWALVVLTLVLYFGIPLLLRADHAPREGGFMKQRGLALVVVVLCSIFFMRADKAYYEAGHAGFLSAQDELINTLALAAEGEHKAADADESGKARPHFRAASEWPGRTMLACKCDTFLLPPVEKDPQTQLTRLRGINFLLFDPKRTANIDLTHNFALLGSQIETVALQPGGVLLHVKDDTAPGPQAGKTTQASGPEAPKPEKETTR